MTLASDAGSDDRYLWLEEITGDRALEWVRERNAQALARLSGGARFEELRAQVREVLDADERIPYVSRRGEHLYNFWQDAEHRKGLWRRTTLEEYRRERPEWEVLIDVDALAAADGESWVWQGATVLRPGGYRQALVHLSRGGADASVVREFDIAEREFVTDGFALPEAKTDVSWIDADHIYVGTDFGPGSLTTSGYPRIVKQWRRGTPLDQAEVVFEGKPEDVAVSAFRDPTPGFERDFVVRSLDFYRSELYLRSGGDLVRIDVPEDADAAAHRQWLLVRTRSAWAVGGATYPAGALLAAPFDAYLAGERDLEVLFEPDERSALSYWAWTRHHLILGTLRDVRSELAVVTPPGGPGPDAGGPGPETGGNGPGHAGSRWRRAPLPGVPELAQTDIAGTDPYDSDEYMLTSSGFTQPATLRRGVIGGAAEDLKREPAWFDADGLSVRQFFATSDDGTRVPYFVTGPEGGPGGPVLLTGYGGFEVSLTPFYSGVTGRAWLARGGTYVVANLRGGGEYGPGWHMSAVKERRHRVYEDFAAVARDLAARGIATRERLGIEGASNGGLLMGVMLTRYPELFGAIACQVPLLDMRRYHELLAGASWIAEYGDPREPEQWEHLRPFSPYHNVAPGRPYPPVLLITSTRDDRVHPGHARKMAALLAEHGYDVTYYENIEGGHGAAADNEQRALKSALVFEFLWRNLAGRGDRAGLPGTSPGT